VINLFINYYTEKNNYNIKIKLYYKTMSIKLVDAFIFYNEIDLLIYRLNLLNDIVDKFIIVEGTYTFVGKPKKS